DYAHLESDSHILRRQSGTSWSLLRPWSKCNRWEAHNPKGESRLPLPDAPPALTDRGQPGYLFLSPPVKHRNEGFPSNKQFLQVYQNAIIHYNSELTFWKQYYHIHPARQWFPLPGHCL